MRRLGRLVQQTETDCCAHERTQHRGAAAYLIALHVHIHTLIYSRSGILSHSSLGAASIIGPLLSSSKARSFSSEASHIPMKSMDSPLAPVKTGQHHEELTTAQILGTDDAASAKAARLKKRMSKEGGASAMIGDDFQYSLGPPDSGFSLFLAERTKKVRTARQWMLAQHAQSFKHPH